MADSRAQENNQTWIADETGVHESASYGVNKESVSAALREQEKRTQLVKDYRGHLKSEKDEEIKEKYEALYVIAEKRLACLKDIEQIANLEDIFGDAASRVTARAAQLAREHEEPDTENPSASLARVAQGCIFAVQDNWSWVSKLVKCVDIHVRHASAYHQFYHELKESDIMMRHALGTGLEKLQAATDQEKRDPQRLLYQLKEFLTLFLHWRGRVDRVFKKSYEIIPVHMRTEPIEYYRPVTALCGYKTRQIDIHEGEEVTLTDNSKPLLWQIRNLKDQEAAVPSVVLVIPGPDTDAVMLANRLRLQLLGLWTQYLKESGRSLLLFLIFVFKQDWDEAELKKLRALPQDQKDALLRILQLIRDYFSRYWSQHPDYKKLVQRLDLFEGFLAEKGNPNDRDLKFGSGFLNQMTTFEEVMNRYQDYWSQWEIYKIALESSRDPQYLVLPDNWENMDFFEISEVLKRWQLGLRGAVMSDMSSSGFESEAFESSITATTSSEFMTSRTVTETTENTDVTDSGVTEETVTEFEEQEETAETDQLMHAEQEVKRTFVIAGVINTATDEEVSMQEAIVMGIINNKDGTYRNMKTGKFIPIPEAMNEGFIRVEFTSTKRSKEKRKDIGLITIKTTREHRPYTVKGVIDSKSDELFSVDDAIARGLLDQKKGVYRNTLHDTDMSLADAIDSGMLKVEYDTSVDVGKPEIITKTYAIHGVVDARRKTKITFTQAVQTGILDKETGAFTNNSTGEQMYVGDAIKKGFIKATVVKDPATLNIDPENKMVVEKLDVLRKKLLKPMIAIAALRKAAQASGK